MKTKATCTNLKKKNNHPLSSPPPPESNGIRNFGCQISRNLLWYEEASSGEKVNLANTKTYIGVAGCTTCDKPTVASDNTPKAATCTACGDGKLVKTVDSVTSCIEEADCNNGYFVDTNGGKKCSACANTCKTCSGAEANQCTSCQDTDKKYLKKDSPTDSTGTCVDAAGCPSTHYIDEAAKTCSTCASAGTTACKTCVKKDGVVTCTSCEDSQKFGLGKKSCVKDCPANSQAGADNVCVCNDSFTPSTDSSACAATSRSVNLSIGAIAGISVAAVVVVGGLVGFLCWWFICRGRA